MQKMYDFNPGHAMSFKLYKLQFCDLYHLVNRKLKICNYIVSMLSIASN